MTHNLWVAFIILNCYDGSWMSHIHRKRDYESFTRPKWNLAKIGCRDLWTIQSVRIVNGDTRIHGRPNRSIFYKRESRDRGTADLVEILKRESTDPRKFGLSIWFDFLKEMTPSSWRDLPSVDLIQILKGESRDPGTAYSVGIFQGGWKDPRVADLVRIFKEGWRDPRTVRLVQIFKGDDGIHGPPNQTKF